MSQYLILKLHGPMQAWGGHTYEDYRPTERFPTRSGLLGLLGACLGLLREDLTGLRALSEGIRIAVRADRRPGPDGRDLEARKITDFHTVENARRVSGRPSQFPVVSRREYLCDAEFTVAVEFAESARYGMREIVDALGRPHFTPSLGRRSCPIARPLFEAVVEADDLHAALSAVAPHAGTVYSEEADGSTHSLRVRDVPAFAKHRQFLTRQVYIHHQEPENVPEQSDD